MKDFTSICRNTSIFIFLATSLLACNDKSKSKKDDAVVPIRTADKIFPVEAKTLPIENLKFTNISLYEVNEKCSGIAEFVDKFFEQYGDGATLTEVICKKYVIKKEIRYAIDFSVDKGPLHKEVEIYVMSSAGNNSQMVSVNKVASGLYNSSLAEISPELGHLEKTLENFIEPVGAEKKAFGRSYQDFVAAAFAQVNSNGIPITGKDGGQYTVTVSLQPLEGNSGEGHIRFKEVPNELLSEGAILSSPGSSNPFMFGCDTLECLNDGSVRYVIAEEFLSIWRESSPGATIFYSTPFTSFPE